MPPGKRLNTWRKQKTMANLVVANLSIKDVRAKRVPFGKVRYGQVFYSEGRWFQRKSKILAIRADTPDNEILRFTQKKSVRVFDENVRSQRSKEGLDFDEFIARAAL